MIGTQELILILLVALLLFGANKLPEMARSLGKATGEFKRAQIESENELKQLNKPKFPESSVAGESAKLLNDKDVKIRNLAIEMGIDVENKTPEQLIEEIHSKIKSNEVIAENSKIIV
jgi:sec-independent protein translocase protein TatA